MINTIEPELNGFKLTSEGKAWIKLLTIKQWMRRHSPGDRYALPKNLNNSKEIISAIIILNSGDNSNLMRNVIKDEENEIIEKNNTNNTYIKIWINAFLNSELLNINVVPFPVVVPEFLIRKCKEEKLDQNQCEKFLEWLTSNKIIEQKTIYQEIIGEIYN